MDFPNGDPAAATSAEEPSPAGALPNPCGLQATAGTNQIIFPNE